MIRIANYSGFYGDSDEAIVEQVRGGPVDIVCGDYLAELTMGLLLRDRMRDASLGYARTALLHLGAVLEPCIQGKIRIVINAGGLNPEGLAQALAALAAKKRLSPRIAWVRGDDVGDRLGQWQERGDALAHLDTGVPLAEAPGQVLAAHAYLGCFPIAEALSRGADVVITGRCTDAALLMGPAAWHHGWTPQDLDPLAGALVAGHIVECGGQATGGNQPFWQDVPDLGRVGYPIAEVAQDGSSVITKHPSAGGRVDRDSVMAQLMYEVGPPAYISPDVVADFRTVELYDEGDDRVGVRGVRGLVPPDTLKVGALVTAGFRNQVKVLLSGPHLRQKADRVAQSFWERVGDDFTERHTELIGAPSEEPATPSEALGVLLLGARSPDRDAVGRRFTSAAVGLALRSVPGLTLLDPPAQPSPCLQFWPILVPRDDIPVSVVDAQGEVSVAQPGAVEGPTELPPVAAPDLPIGSDEVEVRLESLVGARSGDKAGKVNVGLWVHSPERFVWLARTITPQRIADWLEVDPARVAVYTLPNLWAINVVVDGWLGLGVGASLAADAQGKCLAEFLRTRRVLCPVALL